MRVTVNAKEVSPAPLPHSKKMLQEPGYIPPTFPSMNIVHELQKKDEGDDTTNTLAHDAFIHFTSPDGGEIQMTVSAHTSDDTVSQCTNAVVVKSKSKGKTKNVLGVPTLSSTPVSVLTPIKMDTVYVDPALADVSTKNVITSASGITSTSSVYKKRGRKPKGGKIIPMSSSGDANDREIPNIILHLRCFLSDLKSGNTISSFEYVPNIEDVVSYNSQDVTGSDLKDIYSSNTASSMSCGSVENERERVVPINCHTTMLRASSISEHTSVSALGSSSASGPGSGSGSGANMRLPSSGQGVITGYDSNRCSSSDIDQMIPSISSSSEFTVYSSSMLAPTNMIVGHHTNACGNNCNNVNVNVCGVPQSQHSSLPEDVTQKEIWKKINQLKLTFHKSDMLHAKGTGRSACFWDTHDFDTPTIYIPMNIANNTYQVYGCFCSPECAVAYLMNENIDTSTKFERYHLINLLYGKICNYKKSIKPAPNPYYLLNKYYGNLTIQEYRKLFKSEQMIYVVNKPLTHILPELYEDNNDFLINSKVIPTNNLKMKKKYKSSILATTKE